MRAVPVFVLLTALAACSNPSDPQMAGKANSNANNMRIVDAALASGTPTVALQLLESTVAVQPNNTEALVRLGRANAQVGNTIAAESAYRRALTVDHSLLEARLGLARIVMDRDPVEAENLFAGIAKDDAKNTVALTDLGVARDLQGKHAAAQEAYRRALELNPGLKSAQQNLALSLAVSGRAQEGATMLNQMANAGNGGRKLRDNLAVALALAGDTNEAGQVLREELNPADTARALDGYRALRAP
jgi:Flp pilus assembly protein TadD